MSIRIQLDRAWGARIQAPALVMREGFSPRYDLDRWSGKISRIGHSAEGESIAGKILIIPTTKGGVAGGWAFLDLLQKGIAPAAFVFGVINPVMVQGCVLSGIPVADGWDQDVLGLVQTGQMLTLDPAARVLEV